MIIKLIYFMHTGKFYTGPVSWELPTDDLAMYEIFKLVRKYQRRNNLPGVSNPDQFYILIDAPEHKHNHPALILPLKIERFIRNPLVSDSF